MRDGYRAVTIVCCVIFLGAIAMHVAARFGVVSGFWG